MWEFLASDVGKVALGGLIAIAGQIMVFVLGWAKESRVSEKKRELEAQHLGIRLVLVLEKLVGDCYSAVNDQTYTDEQGFTRNAVPNPQFSLPQEGDYRALPAELMYDVMSMPSRLDSVMEGMSSCHEYASPPDFEEYYSYRIESLSKLGLNAMALIESLCDKYKIPPPERAGYYEPEQAFRRYLAKTAEVDQMRAEQQAETHLTITSG
ncbi:hypothetical protein [Pseudomonas laurylsulfatiphila]|uniref:hypothetical protein n=1 Tax=Pseudomonas laurylsulfatiphila TaxID=2011015 RepID=UPI00216010E7|nr:hypothetical protein [Pseudomonas laurylsulfatiphila]UVM06813.1 hypothetical protein LOY25_08945 [Pseudomonas laurylsulfatiphila]